MQSTKQAYNQIITPISHLVVGENFDISPKKR